MVLLVITMNFMSCNVQVHVFKWWPFCVGWNLKTLH